MTITRKTKYLGERNLRQGEKEKHQEKGKGEMERGRWQERGRPFVRSSATWPPSCWVLSFLRAPLPQKDSSLCSPLLLRGGTPPTSTFIHPALCLPGLSCLLSLPESDLWRLPHSGSSPISVDNAQVSVLKSFLHDPAKSSGNTPTFLPWPRVFNQCGTPGGSPGSSPHTPAPIHTQPAISKVFRNLLVIKTIGLSPEPIFGTSLELWVVLPLSSHSTTRFSSHISELFSAWPSPCPPSPSSTSFRNSYLSSTL